MIITQTSLSLICLKQNNHCLYVGFFFFLLEESSYDKKKNLFGNNFFIKAYNLFYEFTAGNILCFFFSTFTSIIRTIDLCVKINFKIKNYKSALNIINFGDRIIFI